MVASLGCCGKEAIQWVSVSCEIVIDLFIVRLSVLVYQVTCLSQQCLFTELCCNNIFVSSFIFVKMIMKTQLTYVQVYMT